THLHAGVRHRHGARRRLGRDDVVPVPVLSGQALGVDRGAPLPRGVGRHGQPARRADRRARAFGDRGLRQLAVRSDLVAGHLLPRPVPDSPDPAAGPPRPTRGDVMARSAKALDAGAQAVDAPGSSASRQVLIGLLLTFATLFPLLHLYRGGFNYWLHMLLFTYMNVAVASSWNIIGGYAGYVSLGHNVFLA